jgi:acetyl/propionyl-CoA carboxylase alpha subunit
MSGHQKSNVIAMKGETQEINTMGDKAMTTMKKAGAPILEGKHAKTERQDDWVSTLGTARFPLCWFRDGR